MKVNAERLLHCTPTFVQQRLQKASLIIPTHNAAGYWARLNAALDMQGLSKHQIVIVDSASTDGTATLAEECGYHVIRIRKADFGHGTTRQMAANHVLWAEFLIFMTQDAIPEGSDTIAKLLSEFDDLRVGVAYGRQLPRREANAIEAHARLFNYPSTSETRNYASRETVGFRSIFCSNSFAAYRRVALEQVGGFPDVIVSEEVTVVARMLKSGWSCAYQADSKVIHSHPMSLRREFSRYFDIAVHHSRESWILETFGRVGGEGTNFVVSELLYLMKHAGHLIPLAFMKNVAKWLGYKVGLQEAILPVWVKKRLSAQSGYWVQPEVLHHGNRHQKATAE